MSEALTFRQALDIDDFDPLSIDITEFTALARSMPRDANLDIPNAEKLAAMYLRAADRCSEILSTLTLKEARARVHSNTTKHRLFLAARAQGHTTVRDREAYSESHQDFIDAESRYNEAYVVKKNFVHRHDWFLKAHQYMKERLRGEYKHQRSSGFSETADSKSYGEKQW
jgi:hypothetical protein